MLTCLHSVSTCCDGGYKNHLITLLYFNNKLFRIYLNGDNCYKKIPFYTMTLCTNHKLTQILSLRRVAHLKETEDF